MKRFDLSPAKPDEQGVTVGFQNDGWRDAGWAAIERFNPNFGAPPKKTETHSTGGRIDYHAATPVDIKTLWGHLVISRFPYVATRSSQLAGTRLVRVIAASAV